MGLFDFLKGKKNEIIEKTNPTPKKEDTPKQETPQAAAEEVEEIEEIEAVEEVEEQEYQWSSKTVQGVHYPNGWEDLSDTEIQQKLEKVFSDYNDADGDDDKEDAVIESYGFESAGHFEEFRNAITMERAEKDGVSFTQAAMNQTVDKNQADVQAAVDAEREDLQPVNGVSLEDWAKASASLASTGSNEEALKITGLDKAGWDQVNQEWQTRMSNDTSFVISQIYGQAFTASSTGNMGGVEDVAAQLPFEKYLEIEVAQNVLVQQGKDAQEVLAMFGMSVTDWSNAGAYWSQEFTKDVDKYYKLRQELEPQFEAKYKGGDANADLEF